jgi:hypothetical protein
MIPQVNADDTTDGRPKSKLIDGKGKSKAANDTRLYSSDIELSSSDQEVGELPSHLTPKWRFGMHLPTASDFSADGLDREMGRRLQPVYPTIAVTYIAYDNSHRSVKERPSHFVVPRNLKTYHWSTNLKFPISRTS